MGRGEYGDKGQSWAVPRGELGKSGVNLLHGLDLTGKVTFEICDLASLYLPNALGIFL